MRGRLVAGTVALFSGLLGWSVLQILAVPVFLHHWGTELYGQWLVLSAGAAFLALLDFGLTTHLTNRILASAARGDGREVLSVLAAGHAILATLMACGAALVAGAWLLDLPQRLGLRAPGAEAAGLLLAASILILLPRPLIGGVFAARGQFGRSVHMSTALQLLPLSGQLAVVAGGGGLVAAAATNLLVVVLTGWVVPLIVLRRGHPDIRLAPRWPAWPELRGYLRKSALYGLSSTSTVALLQLPVLVLQVAAPSGSAVVAFTTMRTAAGVLRQVLGQLVISAALEMTRQHNQGDRDGLARLFAVTARLGGGTAGLLAGPLLVLGPDLFALWTGGAVAFDLGMALVFVTATLAAVPGTVGLTLLRQTDHAEAAATVHLVQLLVGAALCLALVPPLGSLGAAIAVAAAELLSIGVLSSWQATRVFLLNGARLLAAGWGSAAAGCAVGAAVAWALRDIMPVATIFDAGWLMASWAAVVAPAAPYLLFPRDARLSLWRGLSPHRKTPAGGAGRG